MKKMFQIALLALWAFGAQAQTTVTFPPGPLASEAFVRAYVDSALKARQDVTPIVVKPCDAGPEIRSITNITEQSATILFHGRNVLGLDFQITKDGVTLRSGKIRPSSNLLSIGYETLSAGTYTLRLSGNTCLGTSAPVEFTVPKRTGRVDPPRGRTSGQSWDYIGRTDTTYLDITLQETTRGYLITDRTTFPLREGFEYWYTINGQILKSAGPLDGYPYQTKSGVLSITKHHYKKGLDTPARWSSSHPGNNWFQPDASYTFGPRADVGGQSVILLRGTDPVSGELAWLKTAPDWYQGEPVMSWTYRAPFNKVPTGKMFGYNASVAGITSEQRLARGETHISDPSLPISQQLGRVVGCRVLGITTTTGDRDYYRSVADRVALHGAAAYEMNEGDPWLPHGSTQVRQLMERLTERYQQAGYPYFLSPDYGGYAFLTKPIDQVDHRWKYSASAEELRQKDGYFAAFGNSINTINVRNYGSDPAMLGKGFFDRLSHYEIIKRAGYKAIGFTWNFMELFQDGYGPGFAWQHNINGYTVVSSSLAVFPYEEAVTDGFISMFYGDGMWIWDGQGTRNRDKTTIGLGWEGKKTDLGGLPYRTDRDSFEGAFQPEPDSGLEGFYVGAVDITSQCRATEGGERRYLPFTVDGKSYSTEADGSDALTADKENRGICQVRIKDSVATVFFIDPFATLEWRDFSITIGSKTLTGRVFGKRLHVANIAL